MKFVIKIIGALILAYQANAQTILRFQTNITPNAQHLGDVLVITGDKNNLAKIPLDSHPGVGRKITKKQIIAWIKNKRSSFKYQWRGKKTAVIKQRTQTTGMDLINKARSELKNQLEKQEYSHVELTTKTKLKGSVFPLSAFKIQIPSEYPVAKQVCVRLNYEKHSIPVWFTVKAYQKVLVAKHQIKNRTIVREDDFILKEQSISGLKQMPLTKLLHPFWLKKSINAAQVLTQKYLIEIPSIIKGQSVQIKIVTHGVSIITEAIAQNDGDIGQTIRMKNPQTNKYFVAVVTAPNQAEIPS
ncbi:flagellar basal body P-ring formation chaperone FlgA [Legionella maioricensis]|uniref:Flagellar basal body P-ring formation chaperone FlgA n=1 Tax=Legionella maioricensis TaxID=2896528 RepID=A0A9X2I995_9GAMM|nr:flagellar basal body P-ring formation chaperone FlgA [Legionella maioricensis]MCL9682626.1 flagellar basal body P-ring formation chaperone FlgA [Legionella maioricensis]MCL9687327.1 flagellar basal body P-ring formation chaperone FlgA [Legionella maioricensis]